MQKISLLEIAYERTGSSSINEFFKTAWKIKVFGPIGFAALNSKYDYTNSNDHVDIQTMQKTSKNHT